MAVCSLVVRRHGLSVSGDGLFGGNPDSKLLVFHFDPAPSLCIGLAHAARKLIQVAWGWSFATPTGQIEIARVAGTGERMAIGRIIGAATEVRADGLKTADGGDVVASTVANQPDASDWPRWKVNVRIRAFGRDDDPNRLVDAEERNRRDANELGARGAAPERIKKKAKGGYR